MLTLDWYVAIIATNGFWHDSDREAPLLCRLGRKEKKLEIKREELEVASKSRIYLNKSMAMQLANAKTEFRKQRDFLDHE